MANSSLEQFLQKGILSGNFLLLTIVKKHTTGNYIIGDKTCLGVLEHNKNGKTLKVGTGVKLIKPVKVNEYTLQCNQKFPPARTLQHDTISPDEEDIQHLETKLEMSAQNIKEEKYLTFEELKKMPPHTMIKQVTFLVTNTSRLMDTNSGQYQICGLKDINGEKISINLYDRFMNRLEIGKVFTTQKVKKFQIKKEGNFNTRLQTTKYSTVTEATQNQNSDFQNISIADNSLNGTITAFTNISCYYSCPLHWKKVDDDGDCSLCEKQSKDRKFDFKLELHMESDNTEDDIKTFLIFKRAISIITFENDEDAIETKLAEYEGQKCTVEYDEANDEEKLVIAKRLTISI